MIQFLVVVVVVVVVVMAILCLSMAFSTQSSNNKDPVRGLDRTPSTQATHVWRENRKELPLHHVVYGIP